MKNKAILILVVVIVLAFVFRKTLARWVSNVVNPDNLTKEEVLDGVENNLTPFIDVPSPVDGAIYNEAFYESFETEALEIAQILYTSMNMVFTDETAMFSNTVNLNSAQLLCVYRAFGSKAYDPFVGFVLTDDGILMGGSGVVYYGEETEPHCCCYSSNCMEAFYNAMIWQKSGLEINGLTYYNTEEYPPDLLDE